MQRFSVLGAIVAAATLAAGAAGAETANSSAPEGLAWRCQGEACRAASRSGAEGGLIAQCRKVVRAVGPVSSYVSRGQALSPAGLRDCNRVVRPFQTARN